MKKTLAIAIISACTILGGCKCNEALCDDGKPVAPKEQSYERSQSGEPVLPKIIHWWED